MKKITFIALLMAYSATVSSTPSNTQQLDALLLKVQQGYTQDIALDQARIDTFTLRHNQQDAAVITAKKELDTEQQKTAKLHQDITTNRAQISALKKRLNKEKSDLDQLFNALNLAANELTQRTKNSMVSAQFSEQAHTISPLLATGYQSNLSDINNLWSYYLLHMVETRKIATFTTELVHPNGTISQQDVTRLGPFTAFTQQGYTRYLTDSTAFMLLPNQPQGVEQDNLTHFYEQIGNIKILTLDPSRGALLAVAAEKPGNIQRIKQAGIIGFLILALGFVAVIIALHRGIELFKLNKTIQHQRNNLSLIGKNPLGRILAIGARPHLSTEQKTRLIDEAILAELPTLRKGLATLAVLAGVAPLLGLLGTVAGMIETFQAITAFGNANPKILSSGISQALLTTEFGLSVAVPLALIHSYLSNKCTNLIHILEYQGAGLLTLNKLGDSNVA